MSLFLPDQITPTSTKTIRTALATVATNRHCHCNTYATRNYTMEGSAVAHFIVNMGAGNELFIVGM